MEWQGKQRRRVWALMTKTANILGWITVTIFTVFLLYRATNGRTSWHPDPTENHIVRTTHYWFTPNRKIHVHWRRASDGNMGWCIRDNDGTWRVIVIGDTFSDTTASPGPP